MIKKYKPGYYIDQVYDLAIVYPCGRIEVLNYFNQWGSGLIDGYYFAPIEYIRKL
jgi:hypothetical protein